MSAKTIRDQPVLKDFIRQDRLLYRLLIIAIPSVLIQLVVFKIFYPFANFFFTDSFGYLYAAAGNPDVHIWPIGYSKFLRVFNTFFHSDTALVCCQYLFLQACSLYFLFTVCFLFRPSKAVTVILFVFLVYNPLFLYLGNSISSDALFLTLSLCWISQLLWILRYTSRSRLLAHVLLLVCLFTIRHIAVYYPLISVLAIVFSVHTRKEKFISIALSLLLVAGWVSYTAGATKEITGSRTYPPLGGWQLANNALYMMDQLREDTTTAGRKRTEEEGLPARFEGLDRYVRQYFSAEKREKTLFDSAYPGIWYFWNPQSPLAFYAGLQRKKDSTADYFRSWATVSPLYEDYGAWWIRRHPLAFLEYFCGPNTVRFALPPLEFMGQYNSGMDTVDRLSKYWFRYKDQKVHAFSKNVQSYILTPYRPLNLALHLFFLGVLAIFLTTKGILRADPAFSRQAGLIAVFWVVHFWFSVWAAPVVMRYQVFSMILCCSFSLFLTERLLHWEKINKEIKEVTDEPEKNNGRGLRFFPGFSFRLHRDRETL